MDTLELADPAETRRASTYRAAPAYLFTDQFAAVDALAIEGLESAIRWAVMIAMADAGHVPPFFDWEGDYFGAWAPEKLLDDMNGGDARADYYRCLDWALNAAAERYGWPMVSQR